MAKENKSVTIFLLVIAGALLFLVGSFTGNSFRFGGGSTQISGENGYCGSSGAGMFATTYVCQQGLICSGTRCIKSTYATATPTPKIKNTTTTTTTQEGYRNSSIVKEAGPCKTTADCFGYMRCIDGFCKTWCDDSDGYNIFTAGEVSMSTNYHKKDWCYATDIVVEGTCDKVMLSNTEFYIKCPTIIQVETIGGAQAKNFNSQCVNGTCTLPLVQSPLPQISVN